MLSLPATVSPTELDASRRSEPVYWVRPPAAAAVMVVTAAAVAAAAPVVMPAKRRPEPFFPLRTAVCRQLTLGKPFWASALTNFPWAPQDSYITALEQMDPQSQADAIAFGTRRLLQVLPKAPSPRVWSERSVTFQHQTEITAELALLTRDDGTPSSLRELPPPIACLARFVPLLLQLPSILLLA
eukprot:SAG22_NODE_548_length_9247_cov_14.468080_5_plen_185_part_00